jgi:phosphatidylserine/phosphatidylglycerophosphate/cardiolipin synthase-like enzyme
LRDANISVVYADNYRFTFTHAKFFLIDDLLVISTGNLAHTSFISNRDIMLLSREVSVLHFLENLFLADFSHKKYISDTTPDTIVTSPENSRDRIESLIKAAHTSIDLYIQTLEDNDLLDLLKLAQRQ